MTKCAKIYKGQEVEESHDHSRLKEKLHVEEVQNDRIFQFKSHEVTNLECSGIMF